MSAVLTTQPRTLDAPSAPLPESREAVVRLRGIQKNFGGHYAVRDVALDVMDGEFLVMLGPSGSGKTTLLRIIAGFETATAGEVFIRGRDVARVPPNKRNIGVVFQNLALFPHLSVFRNVAFGLEMKQVGAEEIRSRVASALEMVHLGAFAERMPNQLSGGQQQRVALARALVTRPDVLLLDEPLGALDRDLRTEMQSEIRRLQLELGITAVMVTHDQEEAMIIGDRIAILRDGGLQQIGAPREVYENPCSAFTARFMGAANVLPVAGLAEARGVRKVTLEGGAEVAVSASAALPAGRSCLVLRPEAIDVGGDAHPPNRFEGEVTEATFMGAQTRLRVAASAGFELAIWLPARFRGPQPRIGDRVAIGWSPEAAKLVPA